MPQSDVQKFIQSLLQSDFLVSQQKPGVPHPAMPVVTVSRDYGSGGHIVAERIAARLGVPLSDKGLLDAVAQAARVQPELMAELDEKIRNRKDAWLYNLLSGQNAFLTSYRYHLVNVVLALAETGSVILGRGAHLILATRPAFRVRIVGSLSVCARRVAAREGIDLEAARTKVETVNRERDRYLWDLFHHHMDEGAAFDLVLNTDKYGESWDSVTDIVMDALCRSGLPIRCPEEAR